MWVRHDSPATAAGGLNVLYNSQVNCRGQGVLATWLRYDDPEINRDKHVPGRPGFPGSEVRCVQNVVVMQICACIRCYRQI